MRSLAHPCGGARARCRSLGQRGRQVRARDVEDAHARTQRSLERALPFGAPRRVADKKDRTRRRERVLERREERRASAGRFPKRSAECTYRALAGADVARFRREMAERDQCRRGDAVAGRRRIVGAGLGAMVEMLVIVAREVEAAVLAVLELREQKFGDVACPVEILAAKSGLHELEQRIEEEGVIVEVCIEMGALPFACREQSPRAPRGRAQRIGRRQREIAEARLVERPCRPREARDRERIPRRQDLVVEAGPNALRTRREQCRARALEPRLRLRL